MKILEIIVNGVNKILWDYVLLVGLLGVGLFFTIYLGFPQIRRFPEACKHVFADIFHKDKKSKKSDDISSFQALAVAIAAQVGTGNVAGVATAIIAGGPGAIFWMWISAFFGMATIFAEAVLAQIYREKSEDGYVGGPAYYLKNGVGSKLLAGLFSVFIIIALGFIGNMTQSNSISSSVGATFGVPQIAIGIIVAILSSLVFIGGIKRIANFAQLVVPIMAILYIALSIVIMIKFRTNIKPVFSMIISSAFGKEAMVGGAMGISMRQAMRYGIARGLFSNEAGMGSTPHAHATAIVKHPAEQGLTAMFGVFIDTGLVCSATALTILVTGSNKLGLDGALVTQEAFNIAFGPIGQKLIAICLTFFAFTTIVGWYYFGETNILSLFGKKGLLTYRVLVLLFIIIGSVQKIEFVWSLSDMFNGFMVIPNLIGLIYLCKEVKKVEDDYKFCKLNGDIHYNYKN